MFHRSAPCLADLTENEFEIMETIFLLFPLYSVESLQTPTRERRSQTTSRVHDSHWPRSRNEASRWWTEWFPRVPAAGQDLVWELCPQKMAAWPVGESQSIR